jgi:putative transposase
MAIPGGFVYLAAILDAWSRKVVGYAISRSMDARIAVAALKAAIRNRQPPKGCIHHSDRRHNTRLKCIASYWRPTA